MPRSCMRRAAFVVVIAFVLGVVSPPAWAVPVGTPPPVQYTGRVYPADSPTDEDFGYSVAIDGNTAVVGAPEYNGTGAVFVYEYTAAGWIFDEQLVSDADAGEHFGHSVDIDGDVIIVGAPYGDYGSGNTGYAMCYQRGPSSWTYLSGLEPEADSLSDLFGWSVAVDGDTAVVGSPRDDGLAPDAGAIYVFTRDDPSYEKWTAGASETGSQFGTSVDIAGGWIIAGAPYDDNAGGTDAGFANTYYKDITGWHYNRTLLCSDPEANNWFGYAVSTNGTTAMVGAFRYHVTFYPEAGLVDVFTRSGSGSTAVWPRTQALIAPDPDENDNFGKSVSVKGGFALVGAPWDDSYAGSVHVYQNTGGAWTLLQKVTPLPGDSLVGFSVAASSEGRGIVGNVNGSGVVPSSGTACMLAHLDPVYRFYNPGAGTHFFTSSAAERDHVIATWPGVFTYEGPAYSVNPHNNKQPLYRFYKPSSSSHFYTASTAERDHVLATWPHIYQYDGPTYTVTPSAETAKLPVYRFYNVRNGSHFYTASATERDHVIATWPGIYSYEGPAFWLGQ